MKHKKTKRIKKLKPSLYALQSELRKQLQTDPETVQARLDELANTDPWSACLIGENIGLYEPEPEPVYLGNGVYCTANAIIPDGI